MAALSAWGVNELLTIFDETVALPATERREVISTASLELFHSFFRAAGIIAILAIVPAFLMRPSAMERAETASAYDTPAPGAAGGNDS